jgi:hypothetical protein
MRAVPCLWRNCHLLASGNSSVVRIKPGSGPLLCAVGLRPKTSDPRHPVVAAPLDNATRRRCSRLPGATHTATTPVRGALRLAEPDQQRQVAAFASVAGCHAVPSPWWQGSCYDNLPTRPTRWAAPLAKILFDFAENSRECISIKAEGRFVPRDLNSFSETPQHTFPFRPVVCTRAFQSCLCW